VEVELRSTYYLIQRPRPAVNFFFFVGRLHHASRAGIKRLAGNSIRPGVKREAGQPVRLSLGS